MTEQTIEDEHPIVRKETDTPALRPLQFDPEKYRHMLDSIEMSEEEQDEMLNVLWDIMQSFVLMGWGLDPNQSVLGTIAQRAWDAAEEKSSSECDEAELQHTEPGVVVDFNTRALERKESRDE